MVLVYVEVAFGFEFEIEAAVAGDLFEHVVEEADARGDFGLALAVEVEAEGDVGFLRGSVQLRFSHRVLLTKTGAGQAARFCVLRETKRDPSSLRSVGMTTKSERKRRWGARIRY